MRLELTIHDRKGVELDFGDIVKISGRSYSGNSFDFYCEITYLPEVESVAPFHTFAFHSFEKVDKVPDTAVKSDEERYNCWYVPHNWEDDENPQEDKEAEYFNRYLMEWRECEHLLEQKIFRIKFPSPEPKPAANPKQLTLL